MNNTPESVKRQLERLKLREFVQMTDSEGKVTVEHMEADEVAEYYYDSSRDFAEGMMFVLDLIENGYMKARS
ncbi:MAG: hypothetical protein PHV62_05935 [Sulfuricurvum sp.]|nr:hypothetical protein [Sulfuricurvum sp.]